MKDALHTENVSEFTILLFLFRREPYRMICVDKNIFQFKLIPLPRNSVALHLLCPIPCYLCRPLNYVSI